MWRHLLDIRVVAVGLVDGLITQRRQLLNGPQKNKIVIKSHKIVLVRAI